MVEITIDPAELERLQNGGIVEFPYEAVALYSLDAGEEEKRQMRVGREDWIKANSGDWSHWSAGDESTWDQFDLTVSVAEGDYLVGYSEEDDYGAVLPVDVDYALVDVDIGPHNYQLEWHDGDSLVDWKSWTADDLAYDNGAYVTDVEYISVAEATERGYVDVEPETLTFICGLELPRDADFVIVDDISGHCMRPEETYAVLWNEDDEIGASYGWGVGESCPGAESIPSELYGRYDSGYWIPREDIDLDEEAFEEHLYERTLHFAADGYGEVTLRGDADILVYEALDVKDNDYVVFFDGADVIDGEGKWSTEDRYAEEYDFDRDRYDSGLWVSEIPSDVDVIPFEEEHPWERPMDRMERPMTSDFEKAEETTWYAVLGEKEVEALERVGFWPFYDTERDTFTLVVKRNHRQMWDATAAEREDFDAIRYVEDPSVGDSVKLA